MKRNSIKELVLLLIYLLIPFIIYALYKNGYLIYQKKLIDVINIFKPIYFILISVIIKFIIDLIIYKKLKIDYELISVILISMIIPYNTSYIIYGVVFLITYILHLLLKKYITYNNICFTYLVIIAIYYFMHNITFKTPLELNYVFNFSFLDLLIGRNIGGISSTSVLFSLIGYVILSNNYYYKKDIPLIINLVYLLLAFIYFIIKGNTSLLLNADLIFASVFIATIPMVSPYKKNRSYIYSIIIGIISFIISLYVNSIISIYIAIFITSLFLNIERKVI